MIICLMVSVAKCLALKGSTGPRGLWGIMSQSLSVSIHKSSFKICSLDELVLERCGINFIV